MEMNLRKDSNGQVRFSDDLVGYQLVGGGEDIGKIDHASFDGNWATVTVGRISKSRYAIPAWAIEAADTNAQIVEIAFTKDEVLESPEYDNGVGFDDSYEERVDAYYRKFEGETELRQTA